MARQNTPARGHSGSDRPTVTRLSTLPSSAQLYTPRTPWGEIAYQLSNHPGQWFRLERSYSKLSGAISLARKAADEHLAGDASERMEFASEELEDGRVQVYLRLLQPQDDAPEDLADRFDEDDSIFDELETAEGPPAS